MEVYLVIFTCFMCNSLLEMGCFAKFLILWQTKGLHIYKYSGSLLTDNFKLTYELQSYSSEVDKHLLSIKLVILILQFYQKNGIKVSLNRYREKVSGLSTYRALIKWKILVFYRLCKSLMIIPRCTAMHGIFMYQKTHSRYFLYLFKVAFWNTFGIFCDAFISHGCRKLV